MSNKTSQDLGQRFTVDSTYTSTHNGRPARWNHRVRDGVTSERLSNHVDEAAAQRECDARNTDYCHSLATGYGVQELPFWQRETGESWRVIDTRRAEGYEATCALAKVALVEADAQMLADWANRAQPSWRMSTIEALELAREYFAQR